MLLRIGVSNHRSIRGYQELFLSASKRIQRQGVTFPVPVLKEAAAPIVAIYGANASGKSNLIHAIDAMRGAIVFSHKGSGAAERIPREPFLLDDKAKTDPTRFDCTFTPGERSGNHSDDVYEYGFEFTATEFSKEWMYRMVRKERLSTQMLFERSTENGKVQVSFGNQLRGENRVTANLTRPNSLFLSAAAQNNHPQLTGLHQYFDDCWTILSQSDVRNTFDLAELLSECEYTEQLKRLLHQADLGIVDMEISDVEKPDEKERVLMRDFVRAMVKHEHGLGDAESKTNELLEDRISSLKQLRLKHSIVNGDSKTFDYDLESKGTRTLLSLLVPALEVLSTGALLIIDELDTSLHPNLAQAFISLFNGENSNPRGAQLIFSTHDVALLGSGLIQPDGIWMTDKNDEGMSQFIPLTDFKLRSRDNIEKAYRDGRFGGIPTGNDFINEFDDDRLSEAP